MPDIPNQPSQPSQPTQQAASPQPSTPPIHQPPIATHRSPYLLALFTFILGVIGGILLFITYPRFANKPAPAALRPIPSPSPSALPTSEPSTESSPSADLTITPQPSLSITTEPSLQPGAATTPSSSL